MSDGASQGQDISEEQVKTERKTFLDSLVRNEDGSITIKGEGIFSREERRLLRSPQSMADGIPYNTDTYISKAAAELNPDNAEIVSYEIRIYRTDKTSK
ncbi:MAG: hypothetical protein AABX19_03720 [Nanoarchaeota archaeon]